MEVAPFQTGERFPGIKVTRT